MKERKLKLSDKQKEVIGLMRKGYFLYENKITPGARWALVKFEGLYNWGNIHGVVIDKIIHLMEEKFRHSGVREWVLNGLGKSIEL